MLRGLVASGELIARNPAIAGGTTAFLVSLFFVSANALWYQPHFHDGAFFATRKAAARTVSPPPIPTPAPPRRSEPVPAASEAMPQPATDETTGAVLERAAQPAPTGDTQVWKVQSALAAIGIYKGPVDGLSGPQTRAAIENYRRIVGMEAGGGIDQGLLEHLGIAEAPLPAPRPKETEAEAPPQQVAAVAAASDAEIMKIQAGLKAFGNDGIKVDGAVGTDTRAALREFQSLFGLPVTGEPDAAVLAKMKDIGLTN